MLSRSPYLVMNALLAALLALACIGCKSMSGPASASFASVTIKGHSVDEIASVTAQVFQEDGYTGGASGNGQMVFQKEGSKMNNLAYEGVAGSYYGAKTLVRVKADIVGIGSGSHRLQCQAYMVRDAGDSFFEEEQKLTSIRSRPYQSLLNKVAKKLK